MGFFFLKKKRGLLFLSKSILGARRGTGLFFLSVFTFGCFFILFLVFFFNLLGGKGGPYFQVFLRENFKFETQNFLVSISQ